MLSSHSPELSPEPDPPAAAPAAQAVLYRYTIAALHEPSVLPRIVEMFALRDLVPGEVSCRTVQRDGPELRIRVEVCGLDDVHAEHLALRMRNVMPVISVLLERESA